MKKILFILLALLGINALQAQWHEYYTGVTEDLYGVCCIDENTAFVCGEHGVILKTEDGGETWVEKYNNSNLCLNLITFANQQVGFSYGYQTEIINGAAVVYTNRTLLKTTDCGETWIDMGDPLSNTAPNINAVELKCIDADTLFVSTHSCLMKSSDGGASFCVITGAQGSSLYFEDNIGYAISTSGDLYKSEDYGESWQYFFNTGFYIMAVNYINKDTVLIFGPLSNSFSQNNVIGTVDGFETMDFYASETEEGEDEFFYDALAESCDFRFATKQKGCFLSYSTDMGGNVFPAVIATEDGGNTWFKKTDGIDWHNLLLGIDCADTVFYIAAANGFVYKTGIPIYPENIDAFFEDNRPVVLPNPIKEKTKIFFKDMRSVEINDILNRTMLSQKCKGNETEINFSGLEEGIYFLRIRNKKNQEYIIKAIKSND